MAEQPRWVLVQKKAFTRWMNQYLAERSFSLKIEDIQTELADGTRLIILMEIISGKSFKKKWNKNAKSAFQKNENLNMVLDFIKSEGLKLVNIGAADISGGNLRIILGLIWTLILRYQIQTGFEEGSPKLALLRWVQEQVKPYGIQKPTNFTSCWTDGQVLSALTDSLRPGVLNMKDTDPDEHPVDDIQKAMDTATSEYDIEPLMDSIDLHECPDEHSVMSYVAFFRDWLEKEALRQKAPFAANTTAEGPGVEGGNAKKPAPFKIITRTRVNRQCKEGGEAEVLKVDVQGPAGPVDVAPLQDNGDGTYDSVYTPEKAGHYTVNITVEGDPIKDSPFAIMFEGATAGNTWADGPGLTGGKTGRELPFTIHGVDADGNPTKEGGEEYVIKITGPDGAVDPNVNDKNDGEVDVTYVASAPGDYQIEILLQDQPIKDSPWNARVKAAPDASKSWAEGPGLEGGYENVPGKFTVHARDVHDQPVSGDDCAIKVEGPGDAKSNVTDNGDGTYSVEYEVGQAGDYTITSSLDGEPVKNTPVTVHILENPTAQFTQASGPGVEGGRAKQHSPFVVTTKNSSGEQVPLKDAPADAFDVSVTGPAGPVAIDELVDNRNGTYSSGYLAEKAGDYKVGIKLYGQDIQGSPFSLVMEGAHAANTYADGPGLVGGKTGRDLPFTIHGVDADGNATAEGGEPYDVKIDGPNGPVAPTVTDNGDGTVDVVYNVDAPGEYNIDVSLRGEPIKDSPFKAKVKAAPDASKSWAEGPGLQKAYDTEPAKFTVFARDVHGEPVSGDDCAVSVEGPSPTTVNVVDNGDGSYAVEYQVEDEGDFVVTATLDGDVVQKTPVTVKAILGGDPDNCFVDYVLTVHSRDRKGQPKTYGGDRFEVNIKGPEDCDVDSDAVDNGDGSYSAKYSLEGEPGSKFRVYIKLNDKNIKGSPFNHKL
eukprot:CAMPEP_0201487772 /NCGR_PEP_ID=MMETSP0151_2-20130828/15217_1 /ASSEMBLY_ACC=CAM_ASM_000257 /TAXON_ID=200890 /ORGANISM="Paramoeba atlantica, Strain 621/1 / CCAP 1560/9" /LENGTH=932 /DNA_ID=CAMNT_0047872917 /DNA_START=14 /DNA_END=2812 /DNA_ORIENTATION=+